MSGKRRRPERPARPDPAARARTLPEAPSSPRIRPALILALVALLAAIPYLNTLSNGFVLDDLPVIVHNPLLQQIPGVASAFTTSYWDRGRGASPSADPGLYRPLTVLTYAADLRIWGLRPAGYHLTNLLLHTATTLLVFLFALAILGSRSSAFVAAAVFAVHPVHTEAVTSIVGRAEVLATFFFLLAFLAGGRCAARPFLSRPSPGLAMVAAAFCYLLGLFSKETAVTLPLALLAHEGIFRGGSPESPAVRTPDESRRPGLLVAGYALLGVALAGYWVLRSQAVAGRHIWTGFHGVSPPQRVLTAVRVLAEYAGLMLFPWRLSADYWKPEVPIAKSPWDPPVLLSLILGGIAAGLAAWGWRRARAAVFSGALFIITILPMSNLLFAIGVGKAERILYLPSLGFCLLAGWFHRWAERRTPKKWLLIVPVAAYLALLGARTFTRNADWRDNLALAEATLRVSPTSPLMNGLAASEYRARGDADRAARSLERALRERPDFPPYHLELGLVHSGSGRIDQAIEEFRLAVRLDPGFSAAHNELARVYLGRNQIDEAIREFGIALEIDPGDAAAHNNLGSAYLSGGRLDEAGEQFREAIALRPRYAIAHLNLGGVYVQQGRLDDAVRELKVALEIDPASAEAHHNLGAAYFRMGLLDPAIEQYEAALRLRPGWSEVENRLRAAREERQRKKGSEP